MVSIEKSLDPKEYEEKALSQAIGFLEKVND